ncbi:MAG: glycosyltransferase [Lachnospiraceae bacterium]|nr:glycosyltransferase [Lachnospiraceae bacterium]
MKKLTIANLKKTIYYLKRNGLKNTLNAARERLSDTESYTPESFLKEELEAMREEADGWIREAKSSGITAPFFHVLVPAYRTAPEFIKELAKSLRAQVYPRWELLILDASEDEGVLRALLDACSETQKISLAAGSEMQEIPLAAGNENGETGEAGRATDKEDASLDRLSGKVRYLRLASNGGISENTNAGLPFVSGGYVGLLDHDDVLTPNALYEMAKAILAKNPTRGEASGNPRNATGEEKRSMSQAPLVLYSDEDKWDGAARYYEPNRKEDFNLDLLLSNNYICHFLVMKTELFQELKLRKEYDGAQDYDLVLRAAARMLDGGETPEQRVCHVPKVLYHWRCHVGSTAENPQSKRYAYEAGRRALQDFSEQRTWQAKAEDLKHLGFYRLRFDGVEELLSDRKDLGAVGGKILSGNAIAGGRMAEDGSVYYKGLREGFTGYLHRGVLTQDAEAVDLRCICVQKEFWPLFEEVVGVPYRTRDDMDRAYFDARTLPEGADVKALSIAFCKALREKGKRILWDPEMVCRI